MLSSESTLPPFCDVVASPAICSWLAVSFDLSVALSPTQKLLSVAPAIYKLTAAMFAFAFLKDGLIREETVTIEFASEGMTGQSAVQCAVLELSHSHLYLAHPLSAALFGSMLTGFGLIAARVIWFEQGPPEKDPKVHWGESAII